VVYLDTHVVVWAYAGEVDRFPDKVCDLIEANDLVVSPMVLLEMQYLREIGRLTAEPGAIFANLAGTIGLTICDLPLMRVVSEALTQNWTRDPFDRIVVATAAARGAVLLTKDETIRTHYPKARWD